MLTDAQIDQLKSKLQDMKAQILQEPLDDSFGSSYGSIAGEVHDSGDESVASETVEVSNAMAERQSRELSGIDTALRRIAVNTYGICIDCGNEIGFERLRAFPIAQRCVKCKSSYERSQVG